MVPLGPFAAGAADVEYFRKSGQRGPADNPVTGAAAGVTQPQQPRSFGSLVDHIDHHSERGAALFAGEAQELIRGQSGLGLGAALVQEIADVIAKDQKRSLGGHRRQALPNPTAYRANGQAQRICSLKDRVRAGSLDPLRVRALSHGPGFHTVPECLRLSKLSCGGRVFAAWESAHP